MMLFRHDMGNGENLMRIPMEVGAKMFVLYGVNCTVSYKCCYTGKTKQPCGAVWLKVKRSRRITASIKLKTAFDQKG